MKSEFCIYIFILVISFSGLNLYGQTGSDSIINIRIPVSSKKSITSIQHEVFRENFKNDSLSITIPRGELTYYQIQYPGLSILPPAPKIDASDMATNFDEALNFTKYPSYELYDSVMHYYANTYPDICKIDTIGRSIQGRLILALKISDNVNSEEDEPSFLYTATIHGDELVGYMLTMRLINFILTNYGSDIEVDRIVNEVEIWINPLSNPDGTYRSGNSTVAGSIRGNYLGYDLNRNYPDPSVGDHDDTSGVQFENQQMMLFLRDRKFDISANMHAGAEVVNYPWDYTYNLHADDEWYIFISREYADEAHAVNPNYMDDFPNGITNGAEWYVIKGGRQDYVNYYLHGREVTLELCNIKKLESENFDAYWNYNKWSLINMISQARYGIHGSVTSKVTGLPVSAKIWVEAYDDSTSWIESDTHSGNFYRYLKEGTYNLVVSSEGYISDTISNVEVIDYHKTSLNVVLDSTVSTSLEKDNQEEIRIYPNPASDYINVDFRNDNSFEHIVIYNSLGMKVYDAEVTPGKDSFGIDISEYRSGYYLLRVMDENKSATLAFIIR